MSSWQIREGLATVGAESRAVVDIAGAPSARDLHPDDFSINRPSLEDVFLTLTGNSLRS